MKNAKLCAGRPKARILCLAPSLKAGVNERQFVDGSVSLVPKSSDYPSLKAAVRDGRYVMDAVALLVY